MMGKLGNMKETWHGLDRSGKITMIYAAIAAPLCVAGLAHSIYTSGYHDAQIAVVGRPSNPAHLSAAVQNLKACVTAGAPAKETYRGFQVGFAPDGRISVDHVWSNVQPVSREKLQQRLTQERRCNRAAFGNALTNS